MAQSGGSEWVFQLEDVHYAYRNLPALAGVTLTIPVGARIALLGANGSGKSTLLRLLDALYFPDRGRVWAFGQELSPARLADEAFAMSFRRRVGLVFQNTDVQLFNPTVFDELAFGPLQLGWPAERIRARIEQTLTEFDLTHLGRRSPHQLSGGERKRVALASVLICDPEVLLLDEPTAALDPPSEARLLQLLAAWAGPGRTLIAATHRWEQVRDIASSRLRLDGGRLVDPDTQQSTP